MQGDPLSTAYIFGSGGHARVIASLIPHEAEFVVPGHDGGINEAEFFERLDDHIRHPIFIGIGSNEVRRRIFDRLKAAGVTVATCIAPHAFVARTAVIEEGAVICAGAVVGAGARIGRNAIVNTLASVDHDCVLGDDGMVAAGVTIAGTVRIGVNSFFGVKSAVIPGITIGNNVRVRAGAVIVRDVPDDVTVSGIPARIVTARAQPGEQG
jgi:UDP-perosamine 4-acetyltransferase